MTVLIRVIDLETSGLVAPEAEVVEIGWTDVLLNTETREATIGSPGALMFCPERGIPPEVSAVHHITMRHVAGLKTCTLADLREVCEAESPRFIACHNYGFDGQWLAAALPEGVRAICTMKGAGRIWPDAPSKGNSALRYWLELELDENFAYPPHRAGPDSYVTAHILARMLKTETVKDLVKWTLEPLYLPTCPLGKYRGAHWADVDHGYLNWITRTADLDPDTVHAARLELDRRKGVGA